MAEVITAVVESHGIAVRNVTDCDGICLLLDADRIQLLIGVCSDGLPPKYFLEALRPAISVLTDREILQRLTRHSSSMTVLVMDADGMQDAPGQRALKSSLRWGPTDLSFTLTAWIWYSGAARTSLCRRRILTARAPI